MTDPLSEYLHAAASEGAAGLSGPGFGGGSAVREYTVPQQRRAREVLTRLHAVRRAARFYAFEHPAVGVTVGALLDILKTYFIEGADVMFAFFDGDVFLGEQLLAEESVLFDQLVRELVAVGVSSITFRQGLAREELGRAMKVLTTDAADLEARGGIDVLAEYARLPHVEIGIVGILEASSDEEVELSEDVRTAFGGAVSVIREIQHALDLKRRPATNAVGGATKSLVDNVLSNRHAMLQMTSLKNHHEYTFYHSANVAILSVALGSLITRDPRFLSSLGSGALLHDIGKLAVGLDIIEKPGALDPDEWAAMRQHPLLGAEMAADMPNIDRSVLVPILEHHMRWDGSGYPSRTPRRKQHLTSRIVAVADSYDAMTSRRSYSAARIQDQALELIVDSAGSSLDPTLVQLFVRMMGAYPPRSVVSLSDGSVGIVVAPSESDPYRPLVRVLTDEAGKFVTPVDVLLTDRPDLDVSGLIDPRQLNIDIDDYL